MSLSWNESMYTSVPEVDNQHKELFRQVNGLHHAMSQGQGRGEIGKLLDFLGDYAVRHFASEEKHMEERNCPVAAENKRAHGEFIDVFTKLRQRFDDVGPTPSLVLEISDTLSTWLVQHISKIDTKLSGCLSN